MVKIMIVEDDMKIAELLSTHVAKYGYEGIIVSDFQNVLNIFRRTTRVSFIRYQSTEF